MSPPVKSTAWLASLILFSYASDSIFLQRVFAIFSKSVLTSSNDRSLCGTHLPALWKPFPSSRRGHPPGGVGRMPGGGPGSWDGDAEPCSPLSSRRRHRAQSLPRNRTETDSNAVPCVSCADTESLRAPWVCGQDVGRMHT